MAIGTATIDFGAAPGTNMVSVVVTDAGILTASHIEAFFMGTDSTSDHNAYEHMLASGYIQLTPTVIVNGTSFTITAFSELRLTGTFTIHWVYA